MKSDLFGKKTIWDYNILIGKTKIKDKGLFFGESIFSRNFYRFPIESDYYDIVMSLGLIESRSKCRILNIPREIPEGYSEYFLKYKDYNHSGKLSILKII